MVHIPSTYTYDFWLRASTDPSVELSCLMPNGIFIPLEVKKNATLQEIKEDLWEEASKYPLHGMLHDSSTYVFACINSMAENEDLLDESRHLSDVRPFCSVFRLIERKGDKAENTLNIQISHLIGKGLHEFDLLKNPEVNDFRWKMRLLGDEIARERQNKSWLDKMYYQFPPRLAATPGLSPLISSRLRDGHFVLGTKFENTETTFTFNVHYTMTPHELLRTILNKKSITLNSRGEHPADFVLKVCGQEEYLVGNYPLTQFQYVQDMLARDGVPTVVTVSLNSVLVDVDNVYENPEDEIKHTRPSPSTLTSRKKGKHVSSWTINEEFTFRITAICRLNCDVNRSVEVGVQAGLFHGGKSLCETQKTTEKQVSKEGSCEWEEDLTFDLQVCNIPRMARLCLVVYEISKTAKGVKSRKVKDLKQELYINPLAWVNTTVYDFKNQLKTGAMTLYMWTYAEDVQTEDILHPLGTVVSNPNVEHATALTLTFHRYHAERTVMYPSPLLENAASQNSGYDVPGTPLGQTKSHLEFLRQIAERDPLHEMHDQERKIIWSLRYECLHHVPHLLPKLLDCVEWNDHTEVSEVTALLQQWPKLPVEKALELLDYAYADQAVRSFAVQCLKDVSDEDLSLYLLQLVQALKHESYLFCDLVEFLLRRALSNQKIGHYLFWHLRSEMQVASVSVRFGLILEAYCRGSQEHMKVLAKQIESLDKLKTTSEMVRQRKDKDKARSFMQEFLDQKHIAESIFRVLSPLDPSYRCKRLKVDKCKVMDSKMRPLWIVFENDDPYGDDVYIIFKNGDDLRQDMLTLQMIRIMDKLWKKEGLDLRMNPYGCISTEHRVGLIEVVLNAETIANIQKEKGMFSATSAFRKGSLLAWLKDNNQSEVLLNKAIDEFTMSCAGYCVATYVLGVADRHSDNIMVKKTGQLFHIDFGHILGHFKEKFGFRRERVPFVLTHDFVHVINKGQTKKEALEFQVFQKYCEQAFLILRQHGSLIISLFAMMISTGLPELSSEKDLNYLRDTLVMEKSEQDALTHFRSKFDEALCNSWKTSLNWASHNMAKNNKQ
ncbi:phosphatidylinositol 4,5-bisphosphate 3-kinase catalytic subunit delta isoform [Zootermopsis nevadensis]|uniref:phosphatidylinositol 3-kinase n=1 Tax=Zootermopsis nevadensis TaxID=136037 RepID=A0A067RK76_ZOONE|nr:phosphatidylinositol 4,5-bisphosphate 3-kinase catalytic subunit delta isoform [Zootermopsis nevadensis]XP_021917068.1 phosphatidylinositol 4,5-bisphosphate 3-kinase catalytic subunit delta isoform [Zootermopsis nevadensis]XP_021917069.1 phosphatidylinositol 4,5-bisphosphate 3-kinase catalytic subunit delta isoform [Zootermopsis nevadensis]KDR21011.1 Phosphatidylinositol-4,5-bisphosphate 3-kinase catalytic subunit delta isoform [Zootermopsis nevadensis]